jgi:xanthine dehydrogenase molybdopterin-binding subunit B
MSILGIRVVRTEDPRLLTAGGTYVDDLPPGSSEPMTEPLLATDRVRYVGEPVAIVLTDHAYQGEDAAELVSVDYEPLTPVVDVGDSLTDEACRGGLVIPEVHQAGHRLGHRRGRGAG